MKKIVVKRLFCVLIFNFCSLFLAFGADNINIGEKVEPKPSISSDSIGKDVNRLEPSKDRILKAEDTILEIQTNVSGVEVYINDFYVGRSDIELKGYRPGFYLVELRKYGYERERFWVEVRPGRRQTYYVNMQLIVGYTTLTGIPDKAKVYVDGSYTSYDYRKCFSSVPGNHRVVIKCFGYKDYTLSVVVDAYENYEYPVEMELADFEILNFRVSRAVINPEYKNSIGSTEIEFSVTASEPVNLEIQNESGEVVFEYSWSGFTKAEQSLSWNGRGIAGEKLPDGVYTVSIESEHFIFNEKVTIDKTTSIQLFNLNKNGTGVGSLPAFFSAFNEENSTFNPFVVYLKAAPVTGLQGSSKQNGEYTLNLDTGFVVNVPNVEFNFGGSFFPAYEEKFRSFYGTYKMSFSKTVTEKLSVNYGGLIHYGWGSDNLYDKVCFDTGTGLDFGLAGGIDLGIFNFGISSQYIIAAGAGRLGKVAKGREGFTNNIWENGITISAQPARWLNIGTWAALNNLDAAEAGCGITLMPMFAPLLINVNCDSHILFGDCIYIDFGFGLSYLF